MEVVMESSSSYLEPQQTLTEISDDEVNLPASEDEDEAIAAATAAHKELLLAHEAEGDAAETTDQDEAAAPKDGHEVNGVMVLALLDKIIGAVDQIQQTQSGLEARQQDMERSVTGIQGELTKLSKSHSTTSNSVNKMLEKVTKVSVNVKSVRVNLEKQGCQIKKLESNEAELLKRRNFKVMIYQDETKIASKLSVAKSMKVPGSTMGSQGGSLMELKETAEEVGEDGEENHPHVDLSSDEEAEEVDDTVETRTERIKRSSLQRVQNLKTVFSREKMDKTKASTKDNLGKTKENLEKTKQKTKENLEKTKQKTMENLEKTKQKTKENFEKTKQKTKDNLEKTRQNIEKKMGKLGTRMNVNPERKQKMQTSRDKVKKAFSPDHTVYARAKTAVYKVPPFTFHVRKIREGAVEPVHQGTEMQEVEREAYVGTDGEAEEEGGVELEMMNGRGGEEDEEDEEEEEVDSHGGLLEKGDRDRDSD